jgi:hypothetical protein
VVSDTINTMPIPVMDNGNLATNPAKLKATARRSESTSWYGRIFSKEDDPRELPRVRRADPPGRHA